MIKSLLARIGLIPRSKNRHKPSEAMAPIQICSCCCADALTTLHTIPIADQTLEVALCTTCEVIGVHAFAVRIVLSALMLHLDRPARGRGLSAEELKS